MADTKRWWRVSAAAVLAVGAVLRFYDLVLKPMHHDEGVNGMFLVHLLREGYYRYDPTNYHGPTLYYLALLVARVNGFLFGGDGLSDASVRVITALFGVAVVGLVLWMHRLLGKREALVGAALIAVSPGAVFYSRYFIHEILFVFFAMALVACGWLVWERRDPGYLPVGAVAAAFLFATKETALVSVVALAMAVGTQRVWMRMKGVRAERQAEGLSHWRMYWLVSGAVFVAIFVLLYSSFFTNFPKGVLDAVRSLGVWTKTGFSMEFFPKYAYLTWMARQEWPLLVVGVVGTVAAVWTRPASFAALIGIWTAGLFAAYTLIPYKEPWLMLNFTIPAAISGGYGAVRLWERARRSLLVVGVALIGVLVYQSVRLNFVHYDDNNEPYVYMHTTRAINDLMRGIEVAGLRTGEGKKMAIAVVAPEYWPLPWYLRDYPNAGYWGKIINTQAPVVISSKDQAVDVMGRLGLGYKFEGYYDLRPAVTLGLFVRK